jgi:hypothetical protein
VRNSRLSCGVAAVLAAACACLPPALAAQPSEEDTDAIEALRSEGVDLSEPQEVEFLFSFRTAQPARQVGKTLAAEGFRSTLESGGKDVLLLARKRVRLDPQEIGALRARFEALAGANGGQYEGWGIP